MLINNLKSSLWVEERVSSAVNILPQIGSCRADIYIVTGILKGYDQLLNLVMDEVVEEYEGKIVASIKLL